MKRLPIRLLCGLLLCMMLFCACSASPQDPTVSDETLSTDAEKKYSVDDLVLTARVCVVNAAAGLVTKEEESSMKDTEVFCRMPEINEEIIRSKDAKEINKTIRDKYNDLFDEYETTYTTGSCTSRTDFAAAINGTILSLVVECASSLTSYSTYDIFNIDIESGSALSSEETVALAGMTIDEAHQQIIEEITKSFDNQDFGSDFIDEVKTKSLSEENINATRYYFDDSGRLVAVYHLYWIAGAEENDILYRYKEKFQ